MEEGLPASGEQMGPQVSGGHLSHPQDGMGQKVRESRVSQPSGLFHAFLRLRESAPSWFLSLLATPLELGREKAPSF